VPRDTWSKRALRVAYSGCKASDESEREAADAIAPGNLCLIVVEGFAARLNALAYNYEAATHSGQLRVELQRSASQ
jgi:hypothetical protein